MGVTKLDRAFNPGELAVAESLLAGAGIRYFVDNDSEGSRFSVSDGRTCIFVNEEDKDRANDLLEPLMEGG